MAVTISSAVLLRRRSRRNLNVAKHTAEETARQCAREEIAPSEARARSEAEKSEKEKGSGSQQGKGDAKNSTKAPRTINGLPRQASAEERLAGGTSMPRTQYSSLASYSQRQAETWQHIFRDTL